MGSVHELRVEGGLSGFYPDPGDGFVREPWAVTLKAGSFDFTLALLHVTWGRSAVERVQELQRAQTAFAWFQDQDENDIILAGDFNRTPEQAGWGPLVSAGMKLPVAGGGDGRERASRSWITSCSAGAAPARWRIGGWCRYGKGGIALKWKLVV